MPFRVFAAGEVLTAANVNDYLAEQAISTFAGTAARASAITAPTEGQFAYLSDSDSLTFYNGSAWVNAGSAIAGTALSSGTATSGQVLTANGSGGVSFGNGGLTLIETLNFTSASSASFSNNTFSAKYTNYVIFYACTFSGTPGFRLRLRTAGVDNTNSSYQQQLVSATNTTFAGTRPAVTTQFLFNNYAVDATAGRVEIFRPFVSEKTRIMWQDSGSATTSEYWDMGSGFFDNTTSFDSCTIYPSAGNFTGSASVYGYNI